MSSFIDDIINVGSSVWDWATGNSTSAGMARAAALGYMLREVQKSINKDNAKAGSESAPGVVDRGVREQVDPNTENVVPVVYGRAWVRPRVVDAVLTNNNKTMWYAMAICEQTGIIMETGAQSVIQIVEIQVNEQTLVFEVDGVTVSGAYDQNGAAVDTLRGSMRVYAFAGGSDKPVRINGNGSIPLVPAWNLMPGWTSSHKMSNLVFILIRLDYNAEKQVTGLGQVKVRVNNTMSKPGDVIYDYMTNPIYGAGLNAADINVGV